LMGAATPQLACEFWGSWWNNACAEIWHFRYRVEGGDIIVLDFRFTLTSMIKS
jgi:hypothetical protein